ncbi:hypothetical protein MOD59_20570, partial [Bacillus sp. S10C12M]|nr:hypothetical protein [Bacillus sp. S10C12M]
KTSDSKKQKSKPSAPKKNEAVSPASKRTSGRSKPRLYI